MTANLRRADLSLFTTPASECNYLTGKNASTLFVDPRYPLDKSTYSLLSSHGFRRSGQHLYRPYCQQCHACIPVRIPVDAFSENRNQRRNLKRNQQLQMTIVKDEFSEEHFNLYCDYIQSRHRGGGMDNPDPVRYMEFLTSDWCETEFIEFRDHGKLISVAVLDCLENGLSAVYTFFDPDYPERSLGRLGVLTEIKLARQRHLPWLYLGYWISACQKMSYKNEYQPLEFFYDGDWQNLPPENP